MQLSSVSSRVFGVLDGNSFSQRFRKKLPFSRSFQDLFNDILNFPVAQKFIDFVTFASLSDRGKG